ncbi:MAG: hypothetical protein ACLGHE_01960 [Gammaproteobacteria bacterium]
MNAMRTLAPRIAVAACFGLAAASLYAYVGQSQAEARALSFCAASQPGQAAGRVMSRLEQELGEVTAFQRKEGISVIYGSGSQYVCDIRFSGGQVAVAAVAHLD